MQNLINEHHSRTIKIWSNKVNDETRLLMMKRESITWFFSDWEGLRQLYLNHLSCCFHTLQRRWISSLFCICITVTAVIIFWLLNIMREVSLVEGQNECNIRHFRLDCRKKAVTNFTRQWGVYILSSYEFTRHSLSLYMSGWYIRLSVYSRLLKECSLYDCYFWVRADKSCSEFNTLTSLLQPERNQRLFWNIKCKDWHLMSV